MGSRKRPERPAAPRRVADPDSERVLATRELLLDAAEQLLSERGYDKVSVRAVNAAAGLNPGAVHYQFGSKQALFAALLESRLMAVVSGTEAEFEALRARGKFDIRDVVRLQVEPLVELVRHQSQGRLYVTLLARAYLSGWAILWASPFFRMDIWSHMAALALPHLPYQVVAERWRLATDLVLLEIGRPMREALEGDGPIDSDALVEFVSGGLEGPCAAAPRRRSPAAT
jgi:AcrR family transcriptional regulator